MRPRTAGLGWVVVIAGLLGGGAGTARAQYGLVPAPTSSSTMIGPAASGTSGTSQAMNPLLNPYTNPYVYSAYAPQGPLGAGYLFMSMQQAQAQAAQARAQSRSGGDAGPAGRSRGVPRGAMMVPGGGASRYFGGGSVATDEAEPKPVGPRGGSFLRQDRYFRPNGY